MLLLPHERTPRSHLDRWFNEVPVLMLVAIVARNRERCSMIAQAFLAIALAASGSANARSPHPPASSCSTPARRFVYYDGSRLDQNEIRTV